MQIIYSPGMKAYKDKTESISFSIPLVEKVDNSQNKVNWINIKSKFVKTLDNQSFSHLEIVVSESPYKIGMKEEQW